MPRAEAAEVTLDGGGDPTAPTAAAAAAAAAATTGLRGRLAHGHHLGIAPDTLGIPSSHLVTHCQPVLPWRPAHAARASGAHCDPLVEAPPPSKEVDEQLPRLGAGALGLLGGGLAHVKHLGLAPDPLGVFGRHTVADAHPPLPRQRPQPAGVRLDPLVEALVPTMKVHADLALWASPAGRPDTDHLGVAPDAL